MARIPMTSGFTLIPEGTYVFRIYDVSYDCLLYTSDAADE